MPILPPNDLKVVESALLDRVPSHHRDAFAQRWKSALDLYADGEQGAALEALCENIYELNVFISIQLRDHLLRLCQRFAVARDVALLLSEMTRDDEG